MLKSVYRPVSNVSDQYSLAEHAEYNENMLCGIKQVYTL